MAMIIRGRDRIGQRFGHLTIEAVENGVAVCVCDCGRQHRVRVGNLCHRSVKTCGHIDCEYAREMRTAGRVKHNLSGTRLYHIWNNMRGRCYNPNHHSYVNYGNRGITICEEWANDFLVFRRWALDNGYSDDLTIDRIDNDGNYTPLNCRWATAEVQNANKRVRTKFDLPCRILWDIDGVTKSRKDWCREYGVVEATAIYRVEVKGMSPKEALTAPLSTKGRKRG
jgi:hypothetical protein